MEQDREVREWAEVKVYAKDRVQAEEEAEGRENRWAAVDHLHVRQVTVFVPNAASKFLIRSAFPAAERVARNAEQK
jgi:hypothetical protein